MSDMKAADLIAEIERRNIIIRNLGKFQVTPGGQWYWRADHTTLQREMMLSTVFAETLTELFDKILKEA